jgi:UDP-N-acetylmuramyl pentapeptide phosphotransferase/UDP-N-acetylglucosamine-1-phosphate transferase
MAAGRALRAVSDAVPAQRLARTNFRGRTVSLAGGPALALGASAGAALGADSPAVAAAALVAGLGSGAVGGYDDVVGTREDQKAKGFRGHLGALAAGRVTSGMVKIVGVGASALVAAALLPAPTRRAPTSTAAGRAGRAVTVLLGAGVIAGTANLLNLLDLRPGRAGKAALLLGTPLALRAAPGAGLAAGTVGAAAALLPADLDEQIMLGDAGANALGALLGTALAARTGAGGRAALLAGLAALTAASEKVSFTQVIQGTPVLRELDALGRRSD